MKNTIASLGLGLMLALSGCASMKSSSACGCHDSKTCECGATDKANCTCKKGEKAPEMKKQGKKKAAAKVEAPAAQ